MLVIAAEHDQFGPPDRLGEVTSAWPAATLTVVRSADHFLAGAAGHAADEVLAWLLDRTGQKSPR